MTSVFRFIASLIQFAIFLGIAGGLVDMTRELGSKAAAAQSHGILSLGKLNRSLVGSGK
jgi:hypothetical protein